MDVPTVFLAAIRNQYAVPSTRFDTVSVVALADAVVVTRLS